ncbi:hypothetical protein K2173_020905 [Erythroxylum novogranatense]|uniref:Uncharacterized protein n=1 Tax=Erythroxylum novogranatense TaxID=1862640 RepID=A0AAV8TM32_9ROSI|nr:hypothetical protein K2173_020905 [Erythroxylum novogranatense]
MFIMFEKNQHRFRSRTTVDLDLDRCCCRSSVLPSVALCRRLHCNLLTLIGYASCETSGIFIFITER